MSLNGMARRLSLEVPGLPDSYAVTLLNEALGLIQDDNLWSFQLRESNWLTPGLLFTGNPGTSTGTITATAGQSFVTGNASASAAWAAYVAGGNNPFLTQCQIRSPYYSLYNIIGYDTTSHAPFGTFTLDRPWGEPSGAGQSYMVYQAYFAVPVQDFKRFISARDTRNNAPMDFWSKTQKDLSFQDPQRTIFNNPAFFVPYEVDARVGSSTLGFMLYELWPHPLSVLPYTFSYVRRGPQLVNRTDMVPYPLTEELLLWRAKECASLFKESNKGEDVARGSGADWRYLSEACHVEYQRRLKPIRMLDDAIVNLYTDKFRRYGDGYGTGAPFATINGGLNVGRW